MKCKHYAVGIILAATIITSANANTCEESRQAFIDATAQRIIYNRMHPAPTYQDLQEQNEELQAQKEELQAQLDEMQEEKEAEQDEASFDHYNPADYEY